MAGLFIRSRISSLCKFSKSRNFLRPLAFTQFRLTNRSYAYEGPGKTIVTVLNQEADYGIFVDSYSEIGFRLNNGVSVVGPMVLFPFSVLSWNIGGVEDINEDSLSLFSIIEPTIDILVIGTGNQIWERKKRDSIIQYMRKINTNVEILQTDHAISTFNFLNSERRYVAAALVPPKDLKLYDDSATARRRLKESLYRDDEF